MNGHRELLTMRRAGFKPAFVFVNDFPCKTDWAKWGEYPTVSTHGDTPELEDFRFLVGVTAVVAGFDGARIARIAKACEAHAARVIATTSQKLTPYHCDVVCVTDTKKTLTWPK